MDASEINIPVVVLGFATLMAALLFRRYLWLILLPPGTMLLVYIILNTIAQHH